MIRYLFDDVARILVALPAGKPETWSDADLLLFIDTYGSKIAAQAIAPLDDIAIAWFDAWLELMRRTAPDNNE